MSCCCGVEAPTVPPSPPPARQHAPQLAFPPAPPPVQLCAPAAQPGFSRCGNKPLPPGCCRFGHLELRQATGDFAANAVLGEGGFGKVFRGTLEDGTPVAIKCLDRRGLQGDKEFDAEVSTLARLRHPNLVTLLGACTEGGHRLAVFDFMPGGSLRDSLEQRPPPQAHAPPARLLWPARVGIALGAARGLAYMHEGTRPGLIHRDVKSSNVLIDSLGHARIADFGLAMPTGACSGPDAAGFELAPSAEAEILTGTFGYTSPEAELNGRMSQKSDVFSFGVVLLELLTGRGPWDADRPPGSRSLVDVMLPLLRDGDIQPLQAALDPVMPLASIPVPQLAYFSEVARTCLEHNPKNRPRMQQVVQFLEAIASWRDTRLSSSTAAAAALAVRPTLQSLMDAASEVPPLAGAELGSLLASPPSGEHPGPAAGPAWQEAARGSLQFRSDSAFEHASPADAQPAPAPPPAASSSLHSRPSGPALWPSMVHSPPQSPLLPQQQRPPPAELPTRPCMPPRMQAGNPFRQPPLMSADSASQIHGAAGGDAAAGLLKGAAEKALSSQQQQQQQQPGSWVCFGGAGKGDVELAACGGPDSAHLGPLAPGQLIQPRRRPPPPPPTPALSS